MTDLPEIRPIGLTLGGGVVLDDVVGRDEVIANWWKALETRSLRVTEPRRWSAHIRQRRRWRCSAP
jgi:hypothetical protein